MPILNSDGCNYQPLSWPFHFSQWVTTNTSILQKVDRPYLFHTCFRTCMAAVTVTVTGIPIIPALIVVPVWPFVRATFFFFFERWIMAVQISWVGPTWWWLPDQMKQSNESIWCMQTKTALALKAGNFNWKERFSPPLKTPKSLVFCSFSKIPRFQFSPDRSQKKIGEEFSHSCIRIPSY